MRVSTGAQRLLANPDLVPGQRWGMVTNYTAVMDDLELSTVHLHRQAGRVAAILSPEHGLRGSAQAGFAEGSGTDPGTGLPVVDTYGLSEQALDEQVGALALDALVADLQDVGARFYTYVWTVVDCMRSAARLGIPFYILDRPNPISGLNTAGPGLLPELASFVGRLDVPIRHGLTIGEISREAAARDRARGIPVPDPTVITMGGWERSMYWEQTGLPWVMPSPNLPTPGSALAYVGTCLVEGTNLSEGRGTTRPFELIGAPWLDEGFATALNVRGLPGVQFRTASFVPTFSKHAGEVVTGVQVHITDRDDFRPILTGVTLLETARDYGQGRFQWRMPSWEEGESRRPFIDLLWGSGSLREGLDRGENAAQIIADAPKPRVNLAPLLY